MAQRETTVTEKGQVTIPVELRRAIGLKARDKVRFELEEGVITIRRAPSRILAGYGAVTPRHRPEPFSEVRREFEGEVAKEVLGEA